MHGHIQHIAIHIIPAKTDTQVTIIVRMSFVVDTGVLFSSVVDTGKVREKYSGITFLVQMFIVNEHTSEPHTSFTLPA